MTPRSEKLGEVMPETGSEMQRTRAHAILNDAQRRRLGVTCKYIDKLLCDIEQALHSAESTSPFVRHVVDIAPAQARVIEDHIGRLRSQLLQALDWQLMKPDPPEIPVTRSVMTDLAFINIAIEELKPGYMRGCGAVPEGAAAELNGVVHELRSLVGSMESYLRQDLGANLESRLRKLEETGYDVDLLKCIEELVRRHGLVEFHPRIDSLASRLEDNNLEVALFGRVSSGKSSLLNALLGTDVLPVGINPITAVPTRLQFGTTLRAVVTYGNARSEVIGIEELGKLVTEQGNPGNSRNIARALVQVPSSRLKPGIVLVDTPGLGSLARRGSTETLAYLPSCDLALLLIDAGTTLNEEDVGTLRLLCEAAIPVIVLLSKADLLVEDDVGRVAAYIHEQLHRELGLKAPVHSVSSLPRQSALLDRFFEQELLPRFNHARSLRNSSVARKIGALRDAVIAACETALDQQNSRGRDVPPAGHDLEERLRLVTGEVGEQRTVLDHAFFMLAETPEGILNQTVESTLAWMRANPKARVTPAQILEWMHDAVRNSVERAIETARGVSKGAIETLRAVAQEMGRSDMPEQKEAEVLLRDIPRFELGTAPKGFNVTSWMFLGRSVVRARIKSILLSSIGAELKLALHLYGNALSQWCHQYVSRMVILVNSHADTYRVQLQRIAGTSNDRIDVARLEQDLAALRNWNSKPHSEAMARMGEEE
jgi:GTP-binding protein EngB required for normal cell division